MTMDHRLKTPTLSGGAMTSPSTCFAPLTYVGDRRVSNRHGWQVDALSDSCVLDWADGDGTAPNVGPTLTAVGSPTADVSTLWERYDGTDITCTSFSATDMYRTTTATDPALTDDIVIAALVRRCTAGSEYYFSTYTVGTKGVRIYTTGNNCVIYLSGDTNVFGFFQMLAGGWALIGATIDRDGDMICYKDGVSADTDACPTGSLASGAGVGINGYPDNTNKATSDIARMMVWYGSGIASTADATWWKKLASTVCGTHVLSGNDVPTFTRSTFASDTHTDGHIHILGCGMPRAGHSEGYLAEGEIENHCYANFNPSATTGWTATGGTFTVVDDSSALDTAQCREVGPNVFQLANSSGSDQYVYGGGQTGSTNEFSLSVYARITAGSGVRLGLRDASGGGFTDHGAVSDSYTRTEIENKTASDTDEQWCLEIPDGCTVRFWGQQLEESIICSSWIPNAATAATATRNQDILASMAAPPSDTKGRITADIKTLWSGNAPCDARFFQPASGDGLFLHSTDGSATATSDDGTTTADIATAWDGTWQKVKISWGKRLRLDIDGTSDDQAYDGAWGGTGAFGFGQRAGATNGAFARCKNFRVYTEEK